MHLYHRARSCRVSPFSDRHLPAEPTLISRSLQLHGSVLPLELTVDSVRIDTVTLAVLKFGKHPDAREREKITEWLRARTGSEKLRLIAE